MKYIAATLLFFWFTNSGWSQEEKNDSSSYDKVLKPYYQRNSHSFGLGISPGIRFNTDQKNDPGVTWIFGTSLSYNYFILDYVSLGVDYINNHAENSHSRRVMGYKAISPYARFHLPLALFSPKMRHYRTALFADLGYWEGSYHRNFASESLAHPGVIVPYAIRFNALSFGLGLQIPLKFRHIPERWSLQIYTRRNFLNRGAYWIRDMALEFDTRIGLLYHFGKPHRPLVLGDK